MRSVSYYGLLERGIEKSVERSILAVKEDDPVVARLFLKYFPFKNQKCY